MSTITDATTTAINDMGDRTGLLLARATARNARFPSEDSAMAVTRAQMAHDYLVESSRTTTPAADRARLLTLAGQFADRAEALLTA